jgi:iron complex outermembrane receptor protein
MNPKKFPRATSLLLASVTAFPLAAIAAEEKAAEEGTIAEIVVTATKRESSIQKVPFSIAAMTGDKIRDTGTQNIVDIARNVPGLIIADLGPGQSQVAVRGISAGQVVRDQPGVKESVGMYLDESPISIALFTPDLDLFDLDRFEVLRGPQGTLFGAGSSSGTMRYITAQPKIDKFEGSVELGLSSVTDGSTGGDVKAAINLPIGEMSAVRMVGYYDKLPGWIDSVYPDRATIKDVNDGHRAGGRVAMLFKPNDDLRITPRVVYQSLETNGYPRVDFWNILGNRYTTTQTPVDPGERGQVTQFEEGINDRFTLGDLKIEYGFGGATLTSVTSYTDRKVTVLRDASQLTGSVTVQLGGSPADVRLNSPLYDRTKLEAYSEELRLASNGEGQFDWLAGVFYQHVNRRYGQALPTPGYDAFLESIDIPPNTEFGAPADNPFWSDLRYHFKQFAIFGEGNYHFNDQWTLTVGARYYKFDEDRLLTFAGLFANAGNTDVPGSVSSSGVSPRAILSFAASPEVTFNAQASRGFRLGGINDPLNIPICDVNTNDAPKYGAIFHNTWKDEKLWNYEVGMKSRWADGRITFNASVFQADIDNLQGNVDAGSCSSRIVVNVPKARSTGFEVEFFARPTDNWDFGLSATILDAKLRSTVTSTYVSIIAPTAGQTLTENVGGLTDGNRLPTSPKFQGAASVGYLWDWSSGLKGFANLTWQYVGSSYTQLADQEPPFGCVGCPGAPGFIAFGNPTITQFTYNPQLPSYSLGNFRIGVRSGDWEAAAYVNNITDEIAFLSLDRERGTRARVGYLTNQPRTIGVTLSKKF